MFDSENITSNTLEIERPRLVIPQQRIAIISLFIVDIIISILHSGVIWFIPNELIVSSLKFLDPILILGYYFIITLFILKQKQVSKWTGLWLIGWLGLLTWSGISYIVNRPPTTDAIQALFVFCRPLLLLFIFMYWRINLNDYKIIILTAIGFGVVNTLLVIFQFLFLHYQPGDAMYGLFHDAHHQATYCYCLILILIGFPKLIKKQWLKYTLMGLLAVAGTLAQNNKAEGILSVLLLGTFILQNLRNKRIILLVTLLPILTVGIIFIATSQSNLAWRIRQEVTGYLPNVLQRYQNQYHSSNFIDDIGFYQMTKYFFDQGKFEPHILFAGFGLGNYGSPSLLARLRAGGGAVWQRIWFAFDFYDWSSPIDVRLGGLSYKTSLYGSVLGEIGIPGFLFFSYLAILPFFIKLPRESKYFSLLQWLIIAYMFISLQAIVTWAGSWDVDLVTTLIMVGLATCMTIGNLKPS